MQLWSLNVDLDHPGRTGKGWRPIGGSRREQERSAMFSSEMEEFDRAEDGAHLPPIFIDDQLQEDRLINSGSIYIAEPGDTLGSIAATFGTTVDSILSMNADLSRDDLAVDQAVCVMPNSCYTNV